MNKLEIYGVILIVLVLIGLGCYVKGRTDEAQLKDGQYAEKLLKADNKVDTLNGQLTKLSDSHSRELADLNATHHTELADALARVSPVIVRIPTGSVQTPNTTGGPINNPAGSQPGIGGVSTGIDIASAELVFGGKYQTCRDSLATYVRFYETLRARVNAGLPP